MKVLFRTGTYRALLVLIQCPLLHIQIPGSVHHSHSHSFSYLLLQILCLSQTPSHSGFQWSRWVPHNDPYFHTLKKPLLSSYGWNQNTIWNKSCNQSRQSISQRSRFWARLWSDSNPCKSVPLDYGSILKERILPFASRWQENLGHCSSIASNPGRVTEAAKGM